MAKKSARPFGNASYSGKGMMTAYTRSHNGSMTLKVRGKKGSSNGIKNLKGRASTDSYGGPKSHR
jgi:hypothetical protein